MANSDDRQRGYVRKHYEARKAEGKVKCSFWLTPEAAEALEYLMSTQPGMSKTDVINRALIYTDEQTRKALGVLESLKSATN